MAAASTVTNDPHEESIVDCVHQSLIVSNGAPAAGISSLPHKPLWSSALVRCLKNRRCGTSDCDFNRAKNTPNRRLRRWRRRRPLVLFPQQKLHFRIPDERVIVELIRRWEKPRRISEIKSNNPTNPQLILLFNGHQRRLQCLPRSDIRASRRRFSREN